jgi:hypothetical protein
VRDREIYQSSNRFGIPDALAQDINTKYELQEYRSRKKVDNKICHFYLSDKLFETVWSRTNKATKIVSKYSATLSPDFSIYADMPIAMQIWQIYRSRWIARHWQEKNIKVINTVNWSNSKSYNFAFLGIPKNAIVALSVSDIRNKIVKKNFLSGLDEMQKQLKPNKMIIYGKEDILKEYTDVNCEYHTPDWIKMRNRIISNR